MRSLLGNAAMVENVDAVRVGKRAKPVRKQHDRRALLGWSVGPKGVPQSLRVILKELCQDLGMAPPSRGDLTAWAREGVLLLNAALTTEIGRSGAHLKLGWSALADEVVAALSAERPAVAFLLWGADARRRVALVDRSKHLVLESGHPSPLNRARDFPGSRPFSRANEWLASRGLEPVDWRL